MKMTTEKGAPTRRSPMMGSVRASLSQELVWAARSPYPIAVEQRTLAAARKPIRRRQGRRRRADGRSVPGVAAAVHRAGAQRRRQARAELWASQVCPDAGSQEKEGIEPDPGRCDGAPTRQRQDHGHFRGSAIAPNQPIGGGRMTPFKPTLQTGFNWLQTASDCLSTHTPLYPPSGLKGPGPV